MNGKVVTAGCVMVAILASTAMGQMGQRWPSEKKVVPDPVTGIPLSFLTTDPAGDSKIYPTHPQLKGLDLSKVYNVGFGLFNHEKYTVSNTIWFDDIMLHRVDEETKEPQGLNMQ